MNINDLQNILAELVLLEPSQTKELENLQLRTVQAFRQLFPNEHQLITQVQSIRFPTMLGMYSKDFRDMEVAAVDKLKSVLTTKIDVLKHQPVSKTQKDLEEANKHQDATIKQLERTQDQYRTELRKADDSVSEAKLKQREQAVKIEELETKLKVQGRNKMFSTIGFWSLAVAIIGGAFTAGIYAGNVKYDTEKIELSEQNRSLKDSIITYYGVADYLRDKANSAHQLLGRMPYDDLKLDKVQWRKVQTHIESVGFVLDTMAHYKPNIK